jgi:deazaflavin-dependent oxidoreductase (nitroreductase family)
MAVRRFEPEKDRLPMKGALTSLFKSRFGTWMAINVGQRVDPVLMRLSRGHLRTGGVAPTILLTHTGAKSGKVRTTPLLYFTDGDNIVLIASKGGAPKNPAWYHNLKANPDVEASSDGRPSPYRAREAVGPERDRLWALATTLYSGYDDYQEKADSTSHRRIPVIVLEPA